MKPDKTFKVGDVEIGVGEYGIWLDGKLLPTLLSATGMYAILRSSANNEWATLNFRVFLRTLDKHTWPVLGCTGWADTIRLTRYVRRHYTLSRDWEQLL